MFTIRQATIDDCKIINELAWKIFPETYKEILTKEQSDYMMEWMYSLESLERQMTVEKQVFLLAYKEQQFVGYVSIEQQDTDLFHLQKIYVLPAMQGTGCGKYLFSNAVAHIKSVHPSPCTMELNVNRYNRALKFYEHMGMKKVREGDFPIGKGYYMNDYIMAIDI
ncbi:MAG: GNAT family N-acetyltransferase [Prevotellaceae bacterium]|nr:GNAT family N-acetyltransferase [Prevotellaceae bacterium]